MHLKLGRNVCGKVQYMKKLKIIDFYVLYMNTVHHSALGSFMNNDQPQKHIINFVQHFPSKYPVYSVVHMHTYHTYHFIIPCAVAIQS